MPRPDQPVPHKHVPDWFDAAPMHAGLRQRLLATFSLTRDGYVRWYLDRTRFVCGRKTAPDEVEGVWESLRKEIDANLERSADAIATLGTATLRQAAARFFDYLDHRVKHGTPRSLAPVTRADYIRTLSRFGKCVGADRPIAEMGAGDFTQYAKTLIGCAPCVLARHVAYLRAFFRWCVEDDLLETVPKFGTFFKRPSQQRHRDRRLSIIKSYTPAEIQALWKNADDTERLWIALGINGAMDNSDIANFSSHLIDWERGVIDYRRRKEGKVRRVIPMRPELLKLLKKYQRPQRANGADANQAADNGDGTNSNGELFFLTSNGLPLIRLKASLARPGLSNAIDALSQRWRRLSERAGLRQKPIVIENTMRQGSRRRRIKFSGDADGRGFRSLRTTFPNLAPPGYREEVEIVMGHQNDSVLVENYLEHLGLDRLRELVDAVWTAAFTSPPRRDAKPKKPKKPAASGGGRKRRRA
ncbi:MAG TPA: hypothetical protein VK797_23475 [Tepidisphaeraceae bacterium]|nr:hypothetical protein [Tepidisphaeraceae bacterium]